MDHTVPKSRLLILASIAGLFVWLFADALFGGGVFVFRDAGHYYYPLFQFVKSEWMAGRVPLWNPYENLGMPLAGNATSSVFYPGTLVFLLPIAYAWTYKLYVMGHVLLAAWAAYRLARHWHGSMEAAGVAALSYAFSGNVLFQYCNVVFLVGAAWLPLAVLAADRMLLGRSPRWAVILGLVLAMITLGGNAELAYHAGLLAAMYALWLWWHGRAAGPLFLWAWVRVRVRVDSPHTAPSQSPPHPSPLPKGEGERESVTPPLLVRLAGGHPTLLALAAISGLALSAIQVLPSMEFTGLSERATSSVPRSLYEIPAHLSSDPTASGEGGSRWADGLLCRRLDPESHHEHVYHFSVGPWRLAEYLWPNFGGRQFPRHRRWLEVIPGEGRLWVPSLYMGLLPLLLALAAMRFRRGEARESWLSWVVVLSIVAGFGWYGLGWLAHEIRFAAAGDPSSPGLVGEPVGGLYWLLTVALPGYVYFRYPAKLLVIAALGLSMLAARGWDHAFCGPSLGLRRSVAWLGAISLAGGVGVMAIRPLWAGWMAGVPPDMLFGPLDAPGAHADLLRALLQTALLCGLFWWLLGRQAARARWVPGVALLVIAVDLAVANGWMVACAPASVWQSPSRVAGEIARWESLDGDGQPFRVYRRPLWMPPAWQARGSPDRLEEAAGWDRDTLWPKYNLAAPLAVAEVYGTMTPADYGMLLRVARQVPSDMGPETPPRWFLDAVGARYVILRGRESPLLRQPVLRVGREERDPEDCTLWWNVESLPRAWIVHEVEGLAPPVGNDPEALRRRTEQVFCQGDDPRDLRRSATVEKRGQPPFSVETDRTKKVDVAFLDAEKVDVTFSSPLRVEIEAELEWPGLVVLGDQYYPGWQLEVETAGGTPRSVPILRANRVMRGAWLPAGRHRLVYRYRPASFLWGAAISGIGWIALAGLGLAAVLSRRWGGVES